MAETLPVAEMTPAQLWVVGRLVHLRSEDWGTPYLPRWVVEDPLTVAPFNLNRDGYIGTIQSLIEAGWVVMPSAEEGQDSSAVEVEFMATDAAMSVREEVQAALRVAFPRLPDGLPELLLLWDAICNPEGFEGDVIWPALEGPPANLPEPDAIARYRALLNDGWIISPNIEGRASQWFPGSHAWAWSDEILARLEAARDELRLGMATGVANRMELPPDDAVRSALGKLDRAHFVGEEAGWWSYLDRPLPIAFDDEGRSETTTSSPSVCAVIAQTLEIKDGDRILVCGVKGGFTAALCATIAGPRTRVVCLETSARVAEHARAAIARAGLERRIEVRLVSDVTVGTEDGGPWDAVVINGQVPKVPRPIVKQLADQGRFLLFLQEGGESAQTAYLIRKNSNAVKQEKLSSFQFTPIYGEFGYDPPNWPEALHLVGGGRAEAFVSYSSRDDAACAEVVAAFEAAGVRCWYSGRDHPVGRDGYEAAIMDALQGASLFVVLLSHDSIASDHVKNELTNGTHHRKTMLPIRLTECPRDIPSGFQYHLQRFQQYDLHEHPMDQVVGAALHMLGRKADSGSPGGRPSRPMGETTANRAESSRSDSLWDVVLADGRISRDEMALLVQMARNKDPRLSESDARARIEQRARRRLSAVVIEA